MDARDPNEPIPPTEPIEPTAVEDWEELDPTIPVEAPDPKLEQAQKAQVVPKVTTIEMGPLGIARPLVANGDGTGNGTLVDSTPL